MQCLRCFMLCFGSLALLSDYFGSTTLFFFFLLFGLFIEVAHKNQTIFLFKTRENKTLEKCITTLFLSYSLFRFIVLPFDTPTDFICVFVTSLIGVYFLFTSFPFGKRLWLN